MIFYRYRIGCFKNGTGILSSVLALTMLLILLLMPLEGSKAVASDSRKISMIADLLTDRDRDGRLDRIGEKVTIRGRATVGTNVFNEQYLLLYMQDRTAGIMVFSKTLDISVSKGDSLQVTGTLEQHASKPEIVVENLKVLQSDNRIPKAKPLSQAIKNPEEYRGLLVSGEAVVQEVNPPEDIKMLQISTTHGPGDSLHIFVSRANVHYDNFNFSALEPGDRIYIRGILIRYISDYTDKVLYQVLPRTPEDLTINNLQPMVNKGSFIYADIDTTSGTIYLLLESGLWGYNLSTESWRFLNALSDFEAKFSNYEFGFNAQANRIQLWSRGMGKLFSVDPKTYSIVREDQSFKHRNQFGHFPFYRDSTLYAFGGYGFWDYHNMMVHFDYSLNEWQVQTVNRSSPYPSRRVPQTGMYDPKQDQLYIFGGRGTKSGDPEDQNGEAREFWDVWRFSFDSQKWAKIMELEQPENSSEGIIHPSMVAKINKQSSSLYLPDEQLWLIPSYDPEPLFDTFNFRVIDLSSHEAMGVVSPGFEGSNKFMPTNYFYNPDEDEVVFVGIDNLPNANSSPVRIHTMSADSLIAGMSESPFYLSAKLYYYLIGLTVIGGFLYWFYQKRANREIAEEQQRDRLSYDSLLKAAWYNSQEKKLLKYMYEQDQFLDTQDIEELLWDDIESYDYRRRLRNDIIKEINRKFKKHYPGLGRIILRKQDPDDKRRYLYGLNKQLAEE